MKIIDTVLLSLSLGLLIIGVHQSRINGFTKSYWIFMIMFLLLFAFLSRLKPAVKQDNTKVEAKPKKKKK